MASKKKTDLYALLEITKTATDEEIKKAYKKMALKYHPDRNPNNKEEANTKFQEVNTAFKTLSNPEKRRAYDQFGIIDGENNESGEGFPGGAAGMNPFDILNNLFSRGGMGGTPEEEDNKHAKSPNKNITINITLADVYNGKTIPLDFVKNICCDGCMGSGAKSQSAIKICKSCNGKGKIIRMMQMGPMIQQMIQPCMPCSGKGKSIAEGGECAKCHGKKSIKQNRHVDCFVRPGSNAGTSITFKNEADWVEGFGDVGDLVVFVNCSTSHSIFNREGDNLIMKKSISLLEALTESVFYFKHLDERVIKVKYSNIIQPNQRMVIKNEGMPNLKDNLQKGDLIIQFDVVFPKVLDKERAKYLVKILPIPKKQIWDLQYEKLSDNDVVLASLEPFQENHGHNASQGYNQKQDNHGGHPGFYDKEDIDDFSEQSEHIFRNFNKAQANISECTTH
jgi:DnaJ-class molecular chaperone